MSYKFKGVFIPANVWKDKRLTPTKKFILCEIDAMSNGKNEPCYATNSHFSKQFKISKSTISGHINDLIKMGYLIVSYSNEKTKANRRMYTCLAPTEAETVPPTENPNTPTENPNTPTENPNQVNKLLKPLLKEEEEEEEELFSNQKDFVNFCRMELMGKEFKVVNQRYYFTNTGEIKHVGSNEALKGGLAMAIFSKMYENQLKYIRFVKGLNYEA